MGDLCSQDLDRRIADEKAKIAEEYGEIPFNPEDFMNEDWN